MSNDDMHNNDTGSNAEWQQEQDLLDAWVRRELSAEELVALEQRMANDADFQQRAMEAQELAEGIRIARHLDLKAFLKENKLPLEEEVSSTERRSKTWIWWAAATLLLGITYWQWPSQDEEAPLAHTSESAAPAPHSIDTIVMDTNAVYKKDSTHNTAMKGDNLAYAPKYEAMPRKRIIAIPDIKTPSPWDIPEGRVYPAEPASRSPMLMPEYEDIKLDTTRDLSKDKLATFTESESLKESKALGDPLGAVPMMSPSFSSPSPRYAPAPSITGPRTMDNSKTERGIKDVVTIESDSRDRITKKKASRKKATPKPAAPIRDSKYTVVAHYGERVDEYYVRDNVIHIFLSPNGKTQSFDVWSYEGKQLVVLRYALEDMIGLVLAIEVEETRDAKPYNNILDKSLLKQIGVE